MPGKVTGVVFAKPSERFPGKHSAIIWDSQLIDLVVDRALQCRHLDSVIIMSRDPEIKSDLCKVVYDDTDGTLVDSLLVSLRKYGDVFAIGGDMPCIDPEIMDLMLSSFSGKALIPRREDQKYEPLHAIYCAGTADILEKNIREDKRSFVEFIDLIPHSVFNIPRNREFSFYNVNYPSDLTYIKRNGCV